jgi:hypothetical protein
MVTCATTRLTARSRIGCGVPFTGRPMTAPLPPADLLLADPDYALATWGSLFVIVWRAYTPVEAVQEARRQLQAHAVRKGQIGFLTFVHPGAPIPSSTARSELAGLLRDASPFVQASAVVYEGDGFHAAAVRSVVTGLALLARQKFPHKIFGKTTDASAWLVTELRGVLDPSVTPAMLVAMTQDLRRRIDAQVPARKLG